MLQAAAQVAEAAPAEELTSASANVEQPVQDDLTSASENVEQSVQDASSTVSQQPEKEAEQAHALSTKLPSSQQASGDSLFNRNSAQSAGIHHTQSFTGRRSHDLEQARSEARALVGCAIAACGSGRMAGEHAAPMECCIMA